VPPSFLEGCSCFCGMPPSFLGCPDGF